MKTILVPGDFSTEYYCCIEAAISFEQQMPVDIFIVFSNVKDDVNLQKKFAEIIEKFLPTLKHPESNFSYSVVKGKLQDNLPELLKTKKNSLIILTYDLKSKNKNDLTNRDHVIKIIKAVKHNVLTLPNKYQLTKIDTIVFPVHVIGKVRHKVTFTAQVAKFFNSEIRIINVLTSREKGLMNRCVLYTKQIVTHFNSLGLRANAETLFTSNMAQMILNYANDTKADLISIIPPLYKGINLFSKNYMTELINKSKIPLLIIKPRKSKISGSFRSAG